MSKKQTIKGFRVMGEGLLTRMGHTDDYTNRNVYYIHNVGYWIAPIKMTLAALTTPDRDFVNIIYTTEEGFRHTRSLGQLSKLTPLELYTNLREVLQEIGDEKRFTFRKLNISSRLNALDTLGGVHTKVNKRNGVRSVTYNMSYYDVGPTARKHVGNARTDEEYEKLLAFAKECKDEYTRDLNRRVTLTTEEASQLLAVCPKLKHDTVEADVSVRVGEPVIGDILTYYGFYGARKLYHFKGVGYWLAPAHTRLVFMDGPTGGHLVLKIRWEKTTLSRSKTLRELPTGASMWEKVKEWMVDADSNLYLLREPTFFNINNKGWRRVENINRSGESIFTYYSYSYTEKSDRKLRVVGRSKLPKDEALIKKCQLLSREAQQKRFEYCCMSIDEVLTITENSPI